jgi:hypothetical protein
MTWTKSTTTKHTHPVVFGRKQVGCPRCQELSAGAPLVRWSSFRTAEAEAEHIRDIRAHNCKAAGCGPVCTFGEW